MNFHTIIGVVILTAKRKAHIIQHHPIMEDYLENLKEVLEKPEEIRFSSSNDEVLLFYRYFDNIEDGKYIVAVVNRIEKCVTTSYLSHRIKIGRKYEKTEKFQS